MNAMVSTSEEFLLVLKKWHSEETQVSAVAVFPGDDNKSKAILHVSGFIVQLNEAKGIVIISDERANVAYVEFSNCKFVYESEDGKSPDWLQAATSLTSLTGDEYEEMALLVTPNNAKIAIYSLKPATQS